MLNRKYISRHTATAQWITLISFVFILVLLIIMAVIQKNYNYVLAIVFYLFCFSPALYLSLKTFDIFLHGDSIFVKNLLVKERKIPGSQLKTIKPIITLPLFNSPYFKLVLHNGQTYFFPWHKVNHVTFLRDSRKLAFEISEEISGYFQSVVVEQRKF